MNFQSLDIAAFIGFLLVVVGISLYASRGKHDAADYFLAGRNLPWWLIGFSLIASNISTDTSSEWRAGGTTLGLAIASYEWMAAVTLVLVGLFFLPRFLQAGIYTIPEYLEFRYDMRTRTLMAGFIMAAYVFVALATVLYSGALALESIFGIDKVAGIWLIGLLAGGYTIYGGLKAVVWSDLIQGVALLLGGVVVTVLGFRAIGGRDDLQRGPVQAASSARSIIAKPDGSRALDDRGSRADRLPVGTAGGPSGQRLRVHPDVLGIHFAGYRGGLPLWPVRTADVARGRLRRDDPGNPHLWTAPLAAAGSRIPAPYGDHLPGDFSVHDNPDVT